MNTARRSLDGAFKGANVMFCVIGLYSFTPGNFFCLHAGAEDSDKKKKKGKPASELRTKSKDKKSKKAVKKEVSYLTCF